MSSLAGREVGEGSSRYIEVDENEVEDDEDDDFDPDEPAASLENSPASESDGSRHSTRSVSRSQLEEHTENGRRYCSRTYFMPADEAENTRLAVVHQAYLSILEGNLTLAAIPRNVERILDIGTGNGDWALAVAERFASAEVTATDLTTAFQPSSASENVFFEIDDAEDDWTFADPFDFIHVRGLAGAFTDWSKIYKQAAKHLKRGGSFEVADMGVIRLSVEPPDSHLRVFNETMQSAAQKAELPLNLNHLQRPAFNDTGLNFVKTKTFDVPLGTWIPDPRKKKASKMALIAALEGLEAISLRLFTKHLGWSEDDVRSLCDKVKGEIMKEGAKPRLLVTFTVARKIM